LAVWGLVKSLSEKLLKQILDADKI